MFMLTFDVYARCSCLSGYDEMLFYIPSRLFLLVSLMS